jgi:hypothetical protein
MLKALKRAVRDWIALTIKAERAMERLRRTDPDTWARITAARQDQLRGFGL